MAAPEYGRHGEEQEAEAGRVILEVSVVYEDEGGQGEQGGQGGGPGGWRRWSGEVEGGGAWK